MSIGFWFWLIYVLCVVFSIYPWWVTRPSWSVAVSSFWLWVLIAILGWHEFKAPWDALVR